MRLTQHQAHAFDQRKRLTRLTVEIKAEQWRVIEFSFNPVQLAGRESGSWE
jgi:hypothetical protein